VRAKVRLCAEHVGAQGAGSFAEVDGEMLDAGPASGIAAAATAALVPRVRPLHRVQGARVRLDGGGGDRCGGGRRHRWRGEGGDWRRRGRQRQWQRHYGVQQVKFGRQICKNKMRERRSRGHSFSLIVFGLVGVKYKGSF